MRLGEIRLEATSPLRVMQAWGRVVGSPLAVRAQPIDWREGTLTLRVEEPKWRASLEALSSALRDELNAWLGSEMVQEIRFQGPGAPPQGAGPEGG